MMNGRSRADYFEANRMVIAKWVHERGERIRRQNNIRQGSRNLLKRGTIIRKPCEVCGSMTRIQMHHDDFMPGAEYRVRFLCRDHHRELHRQRKSHLRHRQ